MSLSSDKLFSDVERLMGESVSKPWSLDAGMAMWIDYCEQQHPSDVWGALRELDFQSDNEQLTRWLTELLDSEPIPSAINGLWFGLFNPSNDEGEESSQFYLSGSSEFDEPDWQCSTDYWPSGRYAPSVILPELYSSSRDLPDHANLLGEIALCQGYLALTVAQWCRGPQRSLLLGTSPKRGVSIGHDSGDAYEVAILK